MAVPTQITDLSTTATSNSPAGNESIGTNLDDYLRAAFAFIRQIHAGSVNISLPNINGGPLSGDRNRVINGEFKVDRYNNGNSATITAGAALAYVIDRFYAACTGANITGQQVTVNGQKRYRFTGAASNTGITFGHRIRANNSYDMAGTTTTFVVKLSSSSLTSITWAAYYANSTDTFGTLASPTRTQIATGTFTINSTETQYSAQIAVPAAATTGVEVVLTGGALLGSQTLTIGDFGFLPVGVTETYYPRRPFETEKELCEPYLPAIRASSGSTEIIGTGVVNATSGAIVMVPLQTEARVPPTGVFVSGAANYALFDGGSAASANGVMFQSASTRTIGLTVTQAGTTWTVGRGCYLYSQNANALIYGTGCEL